MTPDAFCHIGVDAHREQPAPLESIFGGWPSFHDAEVTAVRVRDAPREYGAEPVESDRYPAIELDVHLDQPQHETAQGDTIVTLRFGSVENVEVGGFNGQNVLFDLQMETSEDETGQILSVVAFELWRRWFVHLLGSRRSRGKALAFKS